MCGMIICVGLFKFDKLVLINHRQARIDGTVRKNMSVAVAVYSVGVFAAFAINFVTKVIVMLWTYIGILLPEMSLMKYIEEHMISAEHQLSKCIEYFATKLMLNTSIFLTFMIMMMMGITALIVISIHYIHGHIDIVYEGEEDDSYVTVFQVDGNIIAVPKAQYDANMPRCSLNIKINNLSRLLIVFIVITLLASLYVCFKIILAPDGTILITLCCIFISYVLWVAGDNLREADIADETTVRSDICTAIGVYGMFMFITFIIKLALWWEG